jgi:aldehyde dehydrogenase (NAD+)
MITKREFYIDGAWVAPLAAKDCPVIDPSTEEACAVISLGSAADTDAAVAAAKAAFPGLGGDRSGQRRKLVEGILEQYHLRKDEMAQAISLEMGAPIDMARDSQAECLPWHLKNFLTAFDHDGMGAAAWAPCARHDDRAGADRRCRPDHALELADEPDRAEGDPGDAGRLHCVLKPSEEAPLNAMLFAEFCHDAGVPPGVFNLVNGDGLGVGTRLSSHPDVEMISFTGSARAPGGRFPRPRPKR